MARQIHVQIVTSAFRSMGPTWASLPLLHVSVSDRRIATGTRHSPRSGDLRAHPEKYRGPDGSRALHGDGPNDEAPRLPGGIPAILDAAPGNQQGVVQPVYPADRPITCRKCWARRSGQRQSQRAPVAADIPEAGHAGGADPRIFVAAANARGLYFCAQTTKTLSADLKTENYPLPVWREPRLFVLRDAWPPWGWPLSLRINWREYFRSAQSFEPPSRLARSINAGPHEELKTASEY